MNVWIAGPYRWDSREVSNGTVVTRILKGSYLPTKVCECYFY